MKKFVVLGAIVLALGAAAGAYGLTRTATQTAGATLDSYSEVLTVSSPGATGQIELTLLGSQVIGYRLRWSGLSGPPAQAHIHFGKPTEAAGVAAFLCGGSTKPACPQSTSGSISGTIVPADVIGPTGQGIAPGEFGELRAAMQAGLTYANIHSQLFPGGEIRGQIHIG